MCNLSGVRGKSFFVITLLVFAACFSGLAYANFSETFTETSTFSDKFIQSGASSYSVSLEVPPGRQDMAPNLEII